MGQQFSAAKLGVWLFLCTEILMFGGLFVGYIIYHGRYPEMFAEGAKHLDWRLGALNTIVLLISSYTMASGIHYAQINDRAKSLRALGITVLCALIFLVVKYFEYHHKIEVGLLPGKYFAFQGAEHANLAMYFSFYFLMTGLHGSHVVAGICLILWVMKRTAKEEFNSDFYTPVESVGLFWHLVDLIWIYLFPLLYLVG
ncbi:MAG: cytochrome c oxidase subunit 3 family protein [Bdellovibrionales bacterium]